MEYLFAFITWPVTVQRGLIIAGKGGTPSRWKPPPGHEELETDFLQERPFPLPPRFLGSRPQNTATPPGARTAVKQIEVFFPSFHGGVGFRGLPPCRKRSRSPEARKSNRGVISPHRGWYVSPDPGPGFEGEAGAAGQQISQIDAHQVSEISGLSRIPLCSPALRSETSRWQQRGGPVVSPRKRKIFIKEAIWSSKCLKAGWWMRPRARPGRISGAAGAIVPMTAHTANCFRGARDCHSLRRCRVRIRYRLPK